MYQRVPHTIIKMCLGISLLYLASARTNITLVFATKIFYFFYPHIRNCTPREQIQPNQKIMVKRYRENYRVGSIDLLTLYLWTILFSTSNLLTTITLINIDHNPRDLQALKIRLKDYVCIEKLEKIIQYLGWTRVEHRNLTECSRRQSITLEKIM